MDSLVALAKCDISADYPYPQFPYGPGQDYPEKPAHNVGKPNPVYHAVRRCFALLGLDRENYGTPLWNPLGEFILPGQQVLIKPNWVMHRHAAGDDLFSVITHPSVIRPVIDYALLALKNNGRLIIADAPLQSADFSLLMKYTQMPQLIDLIPTDNVHLELRDLRQNVCRFDEKKRVIAHQTHNGDPDGYSTVNMGTKSFLHEIAPHARRFRVTNYDHKAMMAHHSLQNHEYLIARTALLSDVIINIPKLKTHRKAGLTCCLKNVIGINGSKDYLPHHRVGALDEGGDEYLYPNFWKRLGSRLYDYIEADPDHACSGVTRFALRLCRRIDHHLARDPYCEGSWYGNDTIWRTALDLNYVLRFARPDGAFAEKPQRRLFNVVDAVIVGGGEGPLRPTSVPAGLVLAGQSRALVDNFAARLIGLDPQKIPLLRNTLRLLTENNQKHTPYRLVSQENQWNKLSLTETRPIVMVPPPAHWHNHVELDAVD